MTKLTKQTIIILWLGLQIYLSIELIPFAYTLTQLETVSSIHVLSQFSDLNFMTRLFSSYIDKFDLLTMILRSINAVEVFSIILNIVLIV